MGNRRFIAVVMTFALLFGQWGAVLHAVEHFSLEHSLDEGLSSTSHAQGDHGTAHHVHEFPCERGVKGLAFHQLPSLGEAGQTRESHGAVDEHCLVFHLHGYAPASLSVSMDVTMREGRLSSIAGEPSRVNPTSTNRAITIRGPPAIS